VNERKHIWQCQQLSSDGTWRNMLLKPSPKKTAMDKKMWLIRHHKMTSHTRVVDVTKEAAS